jgi:hypothetical protein
MMHRAIVGTRVHEWLFVARIRLAGLPSVGEAAAVKSGDEWIEALAR